MTTIAPATPVALWSALWRPSTRTTRRVAIVVVGLLGLLIVTGVVVRLTGSGLGCPTWPDCHGSTIHSGGP